MRTFRHVSKLQSLLRRSLSIMTPPQTPEANMSSSTQSNSSSLLTGTTVFDNIPSVPIPPRGVDYRNKIVLAPMVRSGELPSRLLALHYGADLVWGPETVDRSMIGTTQRTNPRTGCLEWIRKQNKGKKAGEVDEDVPDSIIFRIDPARESTKFIYQIGTANPELAVKAASLVAPYCAGIDVNAGCPKSFSTAGGMGAALLRTPDLLASILTALVKEVGIPNDIGISVKIRLLETPELTSSLVHKLCGTGIIGLTIHCRTTPMRPRERAIRDQLRMIANICHSHGVACLMNGDVVSRDQGLELAEEYGCDGAMIATAAEANSSVFRSDGEGGALSWQDVVKKYLEFAISVENKFGNTKFLLSQLMPGKDPVYVKVQQSRTYAQVVGLLDTENVEMLEKAKALDSILELDAPKTTKADIKRMNKQRAKENQEKKSLKEMQRKRDMQHSNGFEHSQQKRARIRSRSPSSRNENGLNGGNPSRARSTSPKSPVEKARIAADNAGFDGVGEGALAVAV